MLQMQCLPQYNAESSVTNRLAKQLKKAKAVSNIFLTNQQSTMSGRARLRLRSALGAENLYAAMTFATRTSVAIHEGYRKILRRSI